MNRSTPGLPVHHQLLHNTETAAATAAAALLQLCLTLCDPMNLSTPGLPVHHQLPEFIQTHIHQVNR